jgi:DNA-binding winged helix-turn-helix (wHTH) protein
MLCLSLNPFIFLRALGALSFVNRCRSEWNLAFWQTEETGTSGPEQRKKGLPIMNATSHYFTESLERSSPNSDTAIGTNSEGTPNLTADHSWRWDPSTNHARPKSGSELESQAKEAESLGEVVRICDLEVNTRTRTVRRAGRTIALTPHEYALLQYLIMRRGEVVTREDIRQQLYKHHQHRSNVIDAHICYLRTKIDKGFALPLILTRWGQGYLVRADNPQPAESHQ